MSYLDEKTYCVSYENAANLIVSIACLVILLIKTLLFRLCIYDSRMTRTNDRAQLTGEWEFWFHLGRIILMILFVGIPEVTITAKQSLY